jgi:hypothetical protein
LLFAILLLGAGEDDFVLLLAEVEVRAGACEAATGATGAGGCGLLAGGVAGFGFLAALGAGVDFAFAVTTGAAGVATGDDGTGAGAVSATVRTAATGAGAGLAATLTAGAGTGVAAGGGVETLPALTGAEATGCATERSATRFAIEAFACDESFGST